MHISPTGLRDGAVYGGQWRPERRSGGKSGDPGRAGASLCESARPICNTSVTLVGLLAQLCDWFSLLSAPTLRWLGDALPAAMFSSVSQLGALPGLVSQPYWEVSLPSVQGRSQWHPMPSFFCP